MHRPEVTPRPYGAPSLRRLHATVLAALAFAIAACGGAPSTPPPAGSFEIVQPFTSVGRDSIQDVAIDADGDVYLAGYASGAYLDVDHAGGRDAVAARTRADGSVVWTADVTSPLDDEAYGVDVDADGRVAFALTTPRRFGEASFGSFEGRVVVVDADGVIEWDEVVTSPEAVWAYAVAFTPSGGVAVVGETLGAIPGETHAGGSDAYVRVYDRDGAVLWTDQFGTSETDVAADVAVDADGRVLVAARTRGALGAGPSLGSMDALVRLYDAEGTLLWSNQFGSDGFDAARRVTVDQDGGYVAVGTVGGDLVQTLTGERDAFMRRFRLDGSVAGTWQFGTVHQDDANGVAITPSGDLVVAGRFGDGGYLRGYATSGALRFAHTFATVDGSLHVESVAVGADGTVVVAADADGRFDAPGTGPRGAYLLVFDPVP